jgi:hypothetical protein
MHSTSYRALDWFTDRVLLMYYAMDRNRGSMEDARGYKRTIVGTTHQQLSYCTYALVTASFS